SPSPGLSRAAAARPLARLAPLPLPHPLGHWHRLLLSLVLKTAPARRGGEEMLFLRHRAGLVLFRAGGSGEHLANGVSAVGDRMRTASAVGHRHLRIDTEALIDRGADVARADGTILDVGRLDIGGTADTAPLDAGAGEPHAVAERPVIAAGIAVDARRAAH